MKTLLALIIAISLSSVAFARLGETPQQCIARYGKPATEQKDGKLAFIKEGMAIICSFFEGKCDVIAFKNFDAEEIFPTQMKDDVIEALKKANGGGSAWKKIARVSIDRLWSTEDGEAFAQYGTVDATLLIFSKAAGERMTAAAKKQTEDKLKGF